MYNTYVTKPPTGARGATIPIFGPFLAQERVLRFLKQIL